jgi:hypothetical protein
MYKGQLKGVPKEVVDKMLEHQAAQGNKRDVTVFEEYLQRDAINGGFRWSITPECYDFWEDVISKRKFDSFFKRYPKAYQYPKVMMVSRDNTLWFKRVVFMEKCNGYLAWFDVENLRDAEEATSTGFWKYAKDIEEPKQPKMVEVTFEEVAKALNIEPSLLRIKN